MVTIDLPSWLWIVLIAALVAASCSLVGSFLLLRRMAMLGDAISHAVLPGIAIAFLVTQSRNSIFMLIGAALLGLLTTAIVEALSKSGRVRNDAAIGVTFTSLFALGVVLISLYAHMVDLDLDCVLYGEIEYTPLYTWQVGNYDLGPQAFWQMLFVFTLCLLFVGLFFKELKLASFDAEMATAVGINATVVHYALMGVVSVTTVGAFEPVGAILVLAMLIVPPATGYLLFDDLKQMILAAVGCGVLSAALGYYMAQSLNASTAGCMTVVTGSIFALAFLFSPRHGLVTKVAAQRSLSRSVAREDALQALWRLGENQSTPQAINATGLSALTRHEIAGSRRALRDLGRADMVETQNGGYILTSKGERAAQELVHRHRVYESYLEDLGYPADHLHEAADRAEHFISPHLEEALDSAAGNPHTDPHGKDIPHQK